VLAAASYDYAAVIEALIEKRQAGVLGGENLPLKFANGGFVYKYNDAIKAGVSKDVRGKVDTAKAQMSAGKLPLDWKSIKF
jgi:basic membrane protein A